ncbi:MAG: DUF6464 family protein [Cyanobacteria bacterium P01_H01_bin.121]
MLALLIIVILTLAPVGWASWQSRRWHWRYSVELQAILQRQPTAQLLSVEYPPEFRYIEGVGYLIGDLSCRYNARSPLLRCAINPLGPCKGCHVYEPLVDPVLEEVHR